MRNRAWFCCNLENGAFFVFNSGSRKKEEPKIETDLDKNFYDNASFPGDSKLDDEHNNNNSKDGNLTSVTEMLVPTCLVVLSFRVNFFWSEFVYKQRNADTVRKFNRFRKRQELTLFNLNPFKQLNTYAKSFC